MRPINYLAELGARFDLPRETLVVVDRAFADAGLRRKGKGRAIPRPTFDEDAMMTIAALLLPVLTPNTVAAHVSDLWRMPCITARPPQPAPPASFGAGLRDLCRSVEVLVQPNDAGVSFDVTAGTATIDYERPNRSSSRFAVYGLPQSEVRSLRLHTVGLPGQEIVRLYADHRDELTGS